MICTISVARYPKYLSFLGVLSMAVFHFPLFFQKKIRFYKLMGTGKNGTFDKKPDWAQWAILLIHPLGNESHEHFIQSFQLPSFIKKWFSIFNAELCTIFLQPIEGHGSWDGETAFGNLPKQSMYEGNIGVLTRATIRLNKLNAFWKNVDAVANQMADADGFVFSLGIGEVPFIKQATFSVWNSKLQMKNFAYKMHEHADVIRKTKKENWYSEEMFVRFIPLKCIGTINGKIPFSLS